MATSIGSGLGSSFGVGVESTYGTAVTPTRWLTPTDAALALQPQFVQGSGLRQGSMVQDVNERVFSAADAGGTVNMSLFNGGMGLLFASLMGGQGVTPTAVGTSTKQWVFPLAAQFGQSFTIQQGIPDAGTGLLHLWIAQGCKVTAMDLTCEVGSIPTAAFTVDAQDRIESASAPAAVTLPTGNQVFGFPQLKVMVGAYGSEASVDGITNFSASIKRTVSDKRFNIGNVSSSNLGYGIKDQPIDNGFFDLSGTLETEYIDTTKFVDIFMNQTSFSLKAIFTGGLTETGHNYAFELDFPCCRYTGGDPTVAGPDIVKPSMPFIVLNDETHPPATITLTNKDSAF